IPASALGQERTLPPTTWFQRATGEAVEMRGWINLNQASVREFEALPGVSRDLALAIVTNRDVKGPFLAPEDILRVPGVSTDVFRRIGPHLTTLRPTRLVQREASVERPRRALEGTLNVNAATAVELAMLPGMTGARAEQAVRYRTLLRGKFSDMSEVRRAFGMSDANFDAVRPHLALDGPSDLREAPDQPALRRTADGKLTLLPETRAPAAMGPTIPFR
ncbi:MAG: helix-hairpin-helix domain-containing protein, partial [Candidatus Methylomirabilis sp.]|nr:helix-hairpin-helix domain-containing protein [Deltaproteobacteria bacterium]